MATKKSGLEQFQLMPITGGIQEMTTEGFLAKPDAKTGNGSEVRNLENFELTQSGGLKKVGGITQLGATLDGAIQGLFVYKGSRYAIAKGIIYQYKNKVWTNITSGLSETGSIHTSLIDELVILCDGVNKPFTFDGVSLVALAPTLTLMGGKQSLGYHNRLWYFSDTQDTSRVFYSDVLDIDTGYDVGFIACGLNDGQKITAIFPFFIPLSMQPAILVGKTNSVGLITGLGTPESPYRYDVLNSDIGMVGASAFVQYGQNCAYLTGAGVATYIGDKQYGNLIQSYLSASVEKSFLTRVNFSLLENALAWYEPKKRRISFAFTEKGYTKNNVIWHYDVQFEAWYKERFPNTIGKKGITAVYVAEDGERLHGDSIGRVCVQNDFAYNVLGQDITCVLETDSIITGGDILNKTIRQCDWTFESNGVSSVLIETFLEYGNKIGNSYPLTLVSPNNTYTTSRPIWGQSAFGTQEARDIKGSKYGKARYSASPIVRKTIYPAGHSCSIKYRLTHKSKTAGFSIRNMNMLYEASGWR
jgi:hypothetical protein